MDCWGQLIFFLKRSIVPLCVEMMKQRIILSKIRPDDQALANSGDSVAMCLGCGVLQIELHYLKCLGHKS